MRWVTDEQNIPADLRAAGPLLLETLEVAPRQMVFA
jgi:hypothetical protein